jgi:hypothetical protein
VEVNRTRRSPVLEVICELKILEDYNEGGGREEEVEKGKMS